MHIANDKENVIHVSVTSAFFLCTLLLSSLRMHCSSVIKDAQSDNSKTVIHFL